MTHKRSTHNNSSYYAILLEGHRIGISAGGHGKVADNGLCLVTKTCEEKGRVMVISCTGSHGGKSTATSGKDIVGKGSKTESLDVGGGGLKAGRLDVGDVFMI